MGPPVSKERARGTIPSRLTRPSVGLRPAIPLEVDGPRTDPPVSVPMPSWAKVAAMAAPVPPDDPEGLRETSWGLRIHPPTELIVAPEASSLMFTLARMMAPASRSRRTRNASSGGIDPASSTDPPVVGMSEVSTLSFRTTGMPCSGDRGPLAARSRSSSRARSRARSLSQSTVFSAGPRWSYASMRARYVSTSRSAVRVPASKAAFTSATVADESGMAWAAASVGARAAADVGARAAATNAAVATALTAVPSSARGSCCAAARPIPPPPAPPTSAPPPAGRRSPAGCRPSRG